MKNEETIRMERLEQLIQTKTFHELSEVEKECVLVEFETEEQYQTMRKLTLTLHEMAVDDERIKPRTSTLESLKQRLAAEDSADSA